MSRDSLRNRQANAMLRRQSPAANSPGACALMRTVQQRAMFDQPRLRRSAPRSRAPVRAPRPRWWRRIPTPAPSRGPAARPRRRRTPGSLRSVPPPAPCTRRDTKSIHSELEYAKQITLRRSRSLPARSRSAGRVGHGDPTSALARAARSPWCGATENDATSISCSDKPRRPERFRIERQAAG